MRKKGMYFTLMTIASLVIFTFVFMVPGYKKYGEGMMSTEMRVDSMNDFVKNMERDIERGLYIATFRALLATDDYIVTKGKFLEKDPGSSLAETIINGTINNTYSLLMDRSTFTNWTEKIRNESGSFNIECNIIVISVNVYQDDPWNVKASANISYTIKDVTGIASWKVDNKKVETSVSIAGFEDPIYVVYSGGRLTNIINITPFENNYTYKIEDEWNVSNLISQAENSYYTYHSDAPSFIDRLKGTLGQTSSSECCGIESLVNPLKISRAGLPINAESSIVDYYYWDEDNNGDYRVNQTPSWFKIDLDHLVKYNSTEVSCDRDDWQCMLGLVAT